MKQKKIFACLLILSCVAALFGFTRFDDDDVIKKIATQLAKWTAEAPQEKVYLHLDKPYYAIGDDIWFKAYVITGGEHRLSPISSILTVELINPKDSVTRAIKVPIAAGLGWGSFKLADSLKEGNYRLRAYTNWMRNAGEEYFYDKTIQVGDAINNTIFTKASYTYSTNAKNQQRVDATINYADINNKPYAGKEVSYEVQLDARNITRGRGTTDTKGNIAISFTNSMPALLKSGNITTYIKLDYKYVAVAKVIPIKATAQKVDVQFFPESGYLVNGIRSRVAFKAVGSDGLGVDVKGTIVDNQNNQVSQISSQHLGMGVFALVPEGGKTYTAKLTYPDGSTGSVSLPVANDRGYVLSVNAADPDNVVVKISISHATFQENQNSEINLVAQSGGSIVFAAKTKLESETFASRIPRSRFQSGIAQFTLFSAKGEPLNERVAFIENSDKFSVKLSTAKASYSPRDKVKLNVESTLEGKAITGAFSVSVIDETKVPVDESSESTILSNILLTSDIKGYIEKPNYYFNNISDKTRTDLDILMLTQGYRRFAWKQVLADNFPAPDFMPEKSLDITGHIKTSGGKPIPHGKVMLLSTSGGVFVTDTVADEQGMFAFHNLVFTDSVKFVIQARTVKDKKNVEIELDNVQPQLVTRNKNTPDIEVNISSVMAGYLQNSKKQFDDFLKYGLVTRSTLLSEISISEKKAPLMRSDNLNGAGHADQIVKSEQLENCGMLSQCLYGMLNFVIFKGGRAYSTRTPNIPMAIVVDGFTMDADFLDNIAPINVQSIEVLRTFANTAIYGMNGRGGVLVITTKNGNITSAYKRYAPGVITYSPIGYQRIKQFYSPQYDDPKTNAKVADLRTTIYWNPNIITGKDGTAYVEYFNADSPGTYRAVIEGIDGSGNITRQVYRYKVQ